MMDLKDKACPKCEATDVLELTGRAMYSLPVQYEVKCLSCGHVSYVEGEGIKVMEGLTADRVYALNQGKPNIELTCPGCLRIGAHRGSKQDDGGRTCDHCGCEYRIRPMEQDGGDECGRGAFENSGGY